MGTEAIHYAQDCSPLFRLGEDHFSRIGCRTKNTAHLWNHFDGVQHIQRIKTVAQENDCLLYTSDAADE